MDVGTLRRALSPTNASDDTLAEALPHYEEAMRAAQINNPRRGAAWHSQLGHESAGLRYMAETQTSGPGWTWDRTRYRGRGPIQLTWQSNYRRFGQWCREQGYTDNPDLFVDEPELVEQFRWGFLAASWYWLYGGPRPGEINGFADDGDILAVSRCVNGWVEGRLPNGWDDDDNSRLPRYNRALELGDAAMPGPTTGGAPVPTIRPNPGHRGDPTFLPGLLRAWGLNVRELDGWRDRGHGDFGAIWGVVCHHTGSFGETPEGIAFHPSLGLASQIYLGRSGEVVICGVGVAWHAGAGSWPGIPEDGANQVTIGVEAANDGGGSPPGRREAWSPEQYDAYTTLVAAILWYLGHNAEHEIGHKDWAGPKQGKWDPGGIDTLGEFRRDIQRRIDAGPPGARPVLADAAAAHPWLGKQLTEEAPTADGRGLWASFEHGHLYWHPEVGAVPVPAHLFETYTDLGWEAGPLGWPVMVHTVVPNEGDVQAYQRGVLFRRYGQPGYFVTGAIGNRYRLNDWQAGPLGWPTSNETKHGGMIYQRFERGRIAWSPDGTIVITSDGEFI